MDPAEPTDTAAEAPDPKPVIDAARPPRPSMTEHALLACVALCAAAAAAELVGLLQRV